MQKFVYVFYDKFINIKGLKKKKFQFETSYYKQIDQIDYIRRLKEKFIYCG